MLEISQTDTKLEEELHRFVHVSVYFSGSDVNKSIQSDFNGKWFSVLKLADIFSDFYVLFSQ